MKLDERAASARTDLGTQFTDFEPPPSTRIRRIHRRRRALQAACATLLVAVGTFAVIGRTHHDRAQPVKLTPPDTVQPLGDAPSKASLAIQIGITLRFVPQRLEARTGIVRITLRNTGGEHKMIFDDENVRFAGIGVSDPGETRSTRAFFGRAGTYRFYDPLPGHAAAGEEGFVVVTGGPVTLEVAEEVDRNSSHGIVVAPPTAATSPAVADADEASAATYIAAWARGDADGMRRLADPQAVEQSLSLGTATGTGPCTTQPSGQYQCIVNLADGTRAYMLIGTPGAADGRVWWVAAYVPGT